MWLLIPSQRVSDTYNVASKDEKREPGDPGAEGPGDPGAERAHWKMADVWSKCQGVSDEAR
jgi:hypothetical protein